MIIPDGTYDKPTIKRKHQLIDNSLHLPIPNHLFTPPNQGTVLGLQAVIQDLFLAIL